PRRSSWRNLSFESGPLRPVRLGLAGTTAAARAALAAALVGAAGAALVARALVTRALVARALRRGVDDDRCAIELLLDLRDHLVGILDELPRIDDLIVRLEAGAAQRHPELRLGGLRLGELDIERRRMAGRRAVDVDQRVRRLAGHGDRARLRIQLR